MGKDQLWKNMRNKKDNKSGKEIVWLNTKIFYEIQESMRIKQ